jgi:hypothetical protein
MPPSVCSPASGPAISAQQIAIIAGGVAAAVLAVLLALVLVVCCKRRSAGKAHPHEKPPVRHGFLSLRHFMSLSSSFSLIIIFVNCYETIVAQQGLVVLFCVHGHGMARHVSSVSL